MLSRWLGSSPSLILAYDHLAGVERFELEEALDEVSKFYRWVKLSELIERLKKGKAKGLASLTFLNARKSIFLQAAPSAAGRDIPFTTFLQPDCIGLNRLPPLEEFEHFQKAYGEKVPASRDTFKEMSEQTPEDSEKFLLSLRSQLGALPLEKIDPTLFFSTWGKIVDFPPRLQEFGLHLTFRPSLETRVREQLNFIRQQTKNPTKVVYYAGTDEPAGGWASLGIEGVLTASFGTVERHTSPYRLPQWKLVKTGE